MRTSDKILYAVTRIFMVAIMLSAVVIIIHGVWQLFVE